MTRDYYIDQSFKGYILENFSSPSKDFIEKVKNTFYAGVTAADKYPTVTWIDGSIDLPCNHEELVHDSWYTELVFVRIVAKNGVILYTTNAMINVQLDKKWKWTCGEEYKVTHWMPIPKYE